MFERRNLFLASLLVLPLVANAEDAGTRTEGDVIIVEELPSEDAVRTPLDTDRRVPTRGMKKDNVRNVFGEPAREHAPVGEPPITRWDYEDYSVFFEHDTVLHSVVTE